MLTGRSYTTSLGRPCLRESEASAGEFPLVFDGLGVFRGHFYRVIDFPNPRQNCHRTTPAGKGWGEGKSPYATTGISGSAAASATARSAAGG